MFERNVKYVWHLCTLPFSRRVQLSLMSRSIMTRALRWIRDIFEDKIVTANESDEYLSGVVETLCKFGSG